LTGSEQYPGQIIAPRPRGEFVDRTALVCTERILRPGLRNARDEAVLRDLDAQARELAVAATSTREDLADHTWVVETFYPGAQVAWKIAFAAKNALMAQGASVSDRVPMLAAGDIAVLTRMSPAEAYPAACKRYHELGSLGEGDALLAVVSRHPRETTLHAGLCVAGGWTWLR
jgi:hypothetical protein